MSTDFTLLGIGGSGAKAMSAFIHCAAAGLTPPQVTVSLLDQDANNGNVSGTASLINTYRELHRKIGKRLPKIPDQPGLFGCDVALPVEKPALPWSLLGARAQSMPEHFNYSRLRPEVTQLTRALLNQDEEINLHLERGFRGRPAVGAVVISSLSDEHPFQQYLSLIAKKAEMKKQRVFLMGSVFGGMGASGIPTVARTLRRMRNRREGFAIGAGTLLPYFEFPDPSPQTAEAERVAVRATEIPWASRLALEYYHTQITNSGGAEVFDHLYLAGQQPLTSVGYFSSGATGQNNPALLPELLTALGGCHFFAAENLGHGQILRSSHRANHIDWEDLPRVWSTDSEHEVRCALGHLLRFAFAYHYVYFPCIVSGEEKKYRGFDWFHSLIGPSGLSKDDQDTALELNRYCTILLRWAADICFSYEKFGPRAETALDFCKVEGFATLVAGTAEVAGTANVNGVRLRGDDEHSAAKQGRAAVRLSTQDIAALQTAFDQLIGGKEDRSLTLHYIFDALERSPKRIPPGLPAFVDALWRACSVLSSRQRPKPPRWWQ